LRANERTGSDRQIAGSRGESGTSPAHQGRTLAPITWDEIGATAGATRADGGHSEPSADHSEAVDDSGRRFVWLPPRKLHLHANLERYGIATTTAEHNKLAQQADAAFQEAVDITAAGTILDGYPQWKKALDMDCSQVLCIEHLLTDEQELEWLLQRHRRRNGWNRYCRILTALQLEPKFKQEALANQIAGGQKKGLSNLTTAAEMHVRRKLAERADACEAYIDYVKQLRDEAHADILHALERGEVSIHWAWTLLKWSKPEQRNVLEDRRVSKAVRLAFRSPRKRQTASIDRTRVPAALGRLLARDAGEITFTIIPISGKRVAISEELFNACNNTKGELELW
jgi:hypothetical protein